jgi:glycosyltransferase involved in cell wall biosynthesis
VTGVAPWPRRGGFSLRAAHLLERLAADWDLSVVAGCALDRGALPWKDSDRHEVVAAPIEAAWTPSPTTRTALAPLGAAVHEVIRRRKPTAAILWPGVEPVAYESAAFPPAVADRIDCDALERIRALRHSPFLNPQLRALRQAVRSARYERRMVRMFARTVVVGQDDRRALERIAGVGNIVAILNGVVAAPSPAFHAESDQPTVAFTGTLSYHANLDAVRFFTRRLWPGIRARVPGARLLIAGRDAPAPVLALARLPGVEVRVEVPDMTRVLQESWVAVAPMRTGTGVKNKVLEAWGAGRPAVMSRRAANGLELDASMQSLVAPDWRSFGDLVVSLLGDRRRRQALGAAAHAVATSRHSWERSAAAFSKLLLELA